MKYGGQDTESIWIMDAGGSNKYQVTEDRGGGPSWSPDGSQIVYENYTAGGIWVVNIDGTGNHQIRADGRNPSWYK